MNQEDFIFSSTSNPDGSSMNYIIKKYAVLIGIKENVTVYSARSTVIDMLLEKGHPIDRVADFVGHKDIS